MKRMAAWIGTAALVAAQAVGQVPTGLSEDMPSGPGPVGMPLTPEQAKDFGTSSFSTPIDSFAMTPISTFGHFFHTTNGSLSCAIDSTLVGATSSSRAVGQVALPHGVDIQAFTVWGFDAGTTSNLHVTLQSACLPDFAAGDPTITDLATVSSSGSPGPFVAATFVPGIVVADNQSCTYRVTVQFGNSVDSCPFSALNPPAVFFHKARIQWRRQIPLSQRAASFIDVPAGAQFYHEVQALADAGITAGCTPTEFCPDSSVTRRQMAAFLARALGLQPSTLPDPANP